MIAIWYGLVSVMLIVYVALDGRNFGRCCTGLWRGLLRSGGKSWRRSGHYGHGMKFGWSVSAARWSLSSHVSWRARFLAITLR